MVCVCPSQSPNSSHSSSHSGTQKFVLYQLWLCFCFASTFICTIFLYSTYKWNGLPRWQSGKESTCQCRRRKRQGLILGLGISPGGRNCNPLQYSCLKDFLDRGDWGHTWLSMHACINDISFSLSDLLHFIWQSLVSSKSLQMALYVPFWWPSNIPWYICITSPLSISLSVDMLLCPGRCK